eukprot:TRINITY_DN6189_c0_g1_i1.p1 TRINITY_DN6189_c0_g1~~TRINITY_DN6189_c0_g1_i1.p1  ORF type:complete len:562 (-),score=130.10 TRINITY_DN6189_c0_g1_i1:147-1832(-)
MNKLKLVVLLALSMFENTASSLSQYHHFNTEDLTPPQCSVFCTGEILETVQSGNIFSDSKTFVDMPLKYDPSEVIQNFNQLPNHDKSTIQQFLNDNFYGVDYELESWTPRDWVPQPKFLRSIGDPDLKAFASQLNDMWKLLGKKLINDVYVNPSRYSIIPIPNPFIVPGGRFREFYYWDTYWIVRGLLVCNMTETVKGILRNTAYMISQYGFVPNGARIYYLTRSQPPLFSEMVYTYFVNTLDKDLVAEVLPYLDQEYMYWKNKSTVTVTVTDKDGSPQLYEVNRYYAEVDEPRPESYNEDKNNSKGMSSKEAIKFFSNIVAAAESGMDFSSRWFSNSNDITTISTTDVIPVELNSILYKMESNLAYFHSLFQPGTIPPPPVDYVKAMKDRKVAIKAVLWNETTQQWHDYHLGTQSQVSSLYPTNFHPLWSGAYDESDVHLKQQIINALIDSDLIQSGGILTTTLDSGQQWDSPNAWSPLQSFIIFGLIRANTTTSNLLAEKISHQWVYANYIGFKESGFMHEKYNAFIPGQPGNGGEYAPQVGFGWTNGVVLELLNLYGS